MEENSKLEKIIFYKGLSENIKNVLYEPNSYYQCIDTGQLFFCNDNSELVSIGTKGVILFSNSDTNNLSFGTITLSDSAANYEFLEIYAITDDLHMLYQKVCEPNDKMVSFSASLVGQSNFFTKCRVIKIENNTISTAIDMLTLEPISMAGFWGTHNISSFTRRDNLIGIYKVIGYK